MIFLPPTAEIRSAPGYAFPQTRVEADVWKESLARTLRSTDKLGWMEYAKRRGLGADQISQGWAYLSSLAEAVSSWAGNDYGPLPGPTQPALAAPWEVAPPSLGLTTRSARKVWTLLLDLEKKYTYLRPSELISLAFQEAGVPVYEVSQEDYQLIRMGVENLQNGTPLGATGIDPGMPLGRATVGRGFA